MTITWDAKRFIAAIDELSRISGKDSATVIRREIASAVRICASSTKIKSAENTRTNVKRRYMARFQGPAGMISRSGKKLLVWFSRDKSIWGYDGRTPLPRQTVKNGTQAGKKLTGVAARGWHLPDSVWAAAQAAQVARDAYILAQIPLRLRARFLGVGSWVQIADSMGVDINGVPPQTKTINVAEARAAVDRKGRSHQNGVSIEVSSGTEFGITIINQSPSEISRNGQVRLNNALDRRARAFEQNLAHGVFKDVAARVSRYPGLFVPSVPAAAD